MHYTLDRLYSSRQLSKTQEIIVRSVYYNQFSPNVALKTLKRLLVPPVSKQGKANRGIRKEYK